VSQLGPARQHATRTPTATTPTTTGPDRRHPTVLTTETCPHPRHNGVRDVTPTIDPHRTPRTTSVRQRGKAGGRRRWPWRSEVAPPCMYPTLHNGPEATHPAAQTSIVTTRKRWVEPMVHIDRKHEPGRAYPPPRSTTSTPPT